jgi:hypothetical protein
MFLAALRYSMGRRNSTALINVRDNIKENLKELPNDVLTQIKEELIEYYKDRQDDSDYLIAREIIIMIKRELFDD